MNYEDLIVEKVEGWIEIQINRPDKLNALREKTAEEIMSVLAEAEADRGIGVVLIKGSDRAFCTGVDTSEFQVRDGEYFDFYRKRKRSRRVGAMFRDLPSFTKPLISVVEGYALGGGLELALLGDIIVAGTNAKFGLPEARLGMMPGGGGTQTLTRLIGQPLTKELVWTGRRITAEEAKEYRLLNHVTEPGKALEKARELARAICGSAPLSVMLSKTAINRGVDMTLPEGMALENDSSFLLYFSADRKEGLAAFKQKRDANFRGE